MPYPEIVGVLASIETKFGGDITQWISQLLKGVNIAATDSSLKPLLGTDWRHKSGSLRFIDNALTPNEIQHTILDQQGAREIQIPVLDAGINIPVYRDLAQALKGKTIDLDVANNNSIINMPPSAIVGRLDKTQQEVNTVYKDQQNDFGTNDQFFGHNDIKIWNDLSTVTAELGYLGTTSNQFHIPAVGATSFLLAVSKTNIADGDIFYWSAGKLVRLGIGTPGQILKLVSNVPTWQDEIAAAGLPSRGYFAADVTTSTLGLRFTSISGDAGSSSSVANRQIPVSNDIRITRVVGRVIGNTLDGTGLEIGIMDDGVKAASGQIAAATTGVIDQVVNVVIAAGSQIALFHDSLTATTGSYEIRPLYIEYEIGSPGAFEDAKVLIKEIGASIGSVSRNINLSVGTDFDVTENVGTGNYDWKIADNAISTNHIGNAQVTLEKLATDSVDASKIAPAAVGADEIATGAIGSDELATDAVTTTKILGRNVTEAKIELPLLNRLLRFPFRRDWGVLNGRDPTGDGMGLLSDITHDQSGTGFCEGSSGYGEGTGVFYGTTTTSGTRAGERTAQPIVMGSKNPAFFCRFSIGVPTGVLTSEVKFFAGIMQSSTLANSNDPLNSLVGIGIQARSSNTDFRICHCDGSAGDNQVATGVVPASDNVYSFYMYKEEGTTTWHWFIWVSNAGDINTTPTASGTINTLVPGGDTPLYACVSIINNTTQQVWINRGFWAISQDLTGAAQVS